MRRIYKDWKENSYSVQKATGKNSIIQLLEILKFKFLGFSSKSYYAIPLYSEYGKRKLISDKAYNELEKHLNGRVTGVVPFDKWVQSTFWKSNNVPSVKTYGFITGSNCCVNDVVFTFNANIFFGTLNGLDFPIVIKPLDGANGIGFDIIMGIDNNEKSILFKNMGLVRLKSLHSKLFKYQGKNEGYVIQTYIEQHHDLEKIFPNSVNTMRVVTHKDNKGDFSVDCALMKFGSGKSITDNDSEGRVISFMSLENGNLHCGFSSAVSNEKIDFHPDTMFKIRDLKVPFWKDCLQLSLKAHSLLPYPRHLGWDIAITDNGPLIVEMNAFLAISVYQKFGFDLSGRSSLGKSIREI